MKTRTTSVVAIILFSGGPAAFTSESAPPPVVWTDREPLSAPLAERMGEGEQDPPADTALPRMVPPSTPRLLKPSTPGAEAPEPEESSRPAPARSLLNVKVDVTFSEQRGSQAPVTKTVSLTVGDGEKGSVRSLSRRSVPSGIVVAPLNVDARPNVETQRIRRSPVESAEASRDGARPVVEKQRIRLSLSIQYHVIEDVPDSKNTPPVAELGQSLVVVLESGKSMLVTQSADPLSDRKVTLEVKATILP